MPAKPPTVRSTDFVVPPRWPAWLLLVAVVVAYWNSLAVPFVFDDIPTIVEHPSSAAIDRVLQPAPNITTTGRPVLNLTLALNYAAGGLSVRGYHAVNILIHAAAGLVLFGIVRRTWRQAGWAGNPEAVGFVVAALWLLHPLQTESVTYIVQRAESLAGLFYLLTLYGFVRSTEAVQPRAWRVVSVAACLAGMASKEVVVSAPLLVWLYDRTFVAGSFFAAWRQRKVYYLSLMAAWLPLAWLVAGTEGRGGSAGFATGVSTWHYLLTQCQAVAHYLRLTLWPHPFVLDYGTAIVKSPSDVWWQALMLLGLGGGTVWALVRRSAWGFLGVWFFALLAPSSSFVPVATQTMAEHRMYLALAAPAVVVAGAGFAVLGSRALAAGAGLAAVLGMLTAFRNQDYHTGFDLWADTVAHRPDNPRARHNLGLELNALHRPTEAIAQFEAALRLKSDYAEAHLGLGNALARTGDAAGARREFESSVAADPEYAEGWLNLGYASFQAGRIDEAKMHYRRALRLRPDYAEAHNNLGEALALDGDLAAAELHFTAATKLKPEYPSAHGNLAGIRLQQSRPVEAIGEAETALRFEPDNAAARSNLAYALLQVGRLEEAATHYGRLLEREPDNVTAHGNLGFIAWKLGRLREAARHYEAVLRLEPGNAVAREALARLPRGP